MTFHHVGRPDFEKQEDMVFIDACKVWVTDCATSKYKVEYLFSVVKERRVDVQPSFGLFIMPVEFETKIEAPGVGVEQYASTWEKGDVDRMMSYYDKNASAVTLTVNDKSSVELTNVLDRNALELVMVEFFERYRVTNFDFSKTSVYDVKWNSSNVVSCSVDFYADIALSDGNTRKLPLLSFYMQLRREGKKDWRIYFQRIKEVPKYSIQLSEKW